MQRIAFDAISKRLMIWIENLKSMNHKSIAATFSWQIKTVYRILIIFFLYTFVQKKTSSYTRVVSFQPISLTLNPTAEYKSHTQQAFEVPSEIALQKTHQMALVHSLLTGNCRTLAYKEKGKLKFEKICGN